MTRLIFAFAMILAALGLPGTAAADCSTGTDYDCDGVSNQVEIFHGTMPSRPFNLGWGYQDGIPAGHSHTSVLGSGGCIFDANDDGNFNIGDLGAITSSWGISYLGPYDDSLPFNDEDLSLQVKRNRRHDVNFTGYVSLGDIGAVTGRWGNADGCPGSLKKALDWTGRWPNINALTYGLNTSPLSSYDAAIYQARVPAAVSAWNATGVTLLSPVGPTGQPDIYVDAIFSTDFPTVLGITFTQRVGGGWCSPRWDCENATISNVIIHLNERVFQNLEGGWFNNAAVRQAAAAHELGHSLGLGHDYSLDNKDLQDGTCGFLLPQTIMDYDCVRPNFFASDPTVVDPTAWDACGVKYYYQESHPEC